MTLQKTIQDSSSGQAGAYLELTKPGITFFVTVTAAAGYILAALPEMDWARLFHVAFGTAVSTAGALALNQYLEREPDGLMLRTRGRPIPSGRIVPGRARLFGVLLVAAGVGHLWFWVGGVSALLTLFSAVLYDMVYTPMKRRSPLATPVGAIPGALPALIGWTAHAGSVDARGLTLFGILFLWQLIHVLALAWNLKDDYERAGFQLIPR
ncbi:MAG: protoheme IX farnesyltransferase, partial [Longimicrobiales bacterium]